METKRALLAVIISLAILLGYQYFFIPTAPPPPAAPAGAQRVQPHETKTTPAQPPAAPAEVAAPQAPQEPRRQGRDIKVETNLYSAVITENGGGIKSFKLKKYRETLSPQSDFKQLITTNLPSELPLYFTWGVEPDKTWVPVFEADRQRVTLTDGKGEEQLVLTSRLPSGLEITKTFRFSSNDYRIGLRVDVHNTSGQPLQGSPYLRLTGRPFSSAKSARFLFNGPALYLDNSLREVKPKELESGGLTLNGQIQWTAYEGHYFMLGVLPTVPDQQSVRLSVGDTDKTTILLTENAALIPPQGRSQFEYTAFFGPKKLSLLKAMDHNLAAIVNFGWFDFLAKPMLYLLNFFYGFVGNYGVAIILVTIVVKLLFWPIAHKGMKSMRTMQKLQPKMAKLKEKYGDDRERLNQEMMKLYQTYKINPLGGCLPMILQIPVFFALYKVLLLTIELRHAPFVLWINDLSAPDRLYLGFHIPYLGGLPVLTLLMGGSMFLQQKMTPTSADPTQAKVMLFLPVVFTFMFINFASGLVLYWFVNNLLSMAQQYVINRQTAAED
ncbi:MAG: membrane protein insertase YidC [Desulfobacteraceae bacterium]|nr:membrane protein insertase YidC [Desulfobacteraceae bacterium]